jgi:hypothetical protein
MTGSSDAEKQMIISSDMQINNQYAPQQQQSSANSSASSLSNQRQISRKLVNARQSARFSPATPSPMSPISPTLTPSNSTLIINNSSQLHSPGMTLGFEQQQQQQQQQGPFRHFSNFDFNKSHTDIHQQAMMAQQMISIDHNHP